MSVHSLPDHVLKKIFMYVDFPQKGSCKLVCLRWEHLMEEVIGEYWRHRCHRDFAEEADEAYRKAQLSWEQLYNSLSLWSNIKSARIAGTYETCDNVVHVRNTSIWERNQRFFMLKDGMVAVSESRGRHTPPQKRCCVELGECNTIVYYKLDSMKEVCHRKINFNFNRHYETDDIIVLRDHDKLYVIIKSNNKIFNIGALYGHEWGDVSEFHAIKNDIYFMTKSRELWVSKLHHENDDISMKSEPVLTIDMQEEAAQNGFGGWVCNSISAVTYHNNQLNILHSRGLIFTVKDVNGQKELQYLTQIKKKMTNRNEVVNVLKQHGFDWSQHDVYKFIKSRDIIEGDWVAITKLKDAIIHRQGKVVLIATCIRTIHVYYDPYTKYGQLKLYNAKPVMKIDMNELNYIDPDNFYYRKIEQLDIQEIEKGHRIVMLYANRIAVVELFHGGVKRPCPERQEVMRYYRHRTRYGHRSDDNDDDDLYTDRSSSEEEL